MKHLVLVGGGHSHVAVLKRFGMAPMDGVRVTLISRGAETPYSGMLPGVIAGHYTRDDAHIDLQRLARFAGARFYVDEAIGLDLVAGAVHCAGRPPVRYDTLSIDIGSTPNVSVPGAAAHATPVKPIDQFLRRWDDLCRRIAADARPRHIAVVGGGAGGVELLLSVQHRLQTLAGSGANGASRLAFHLFSATETLLPTHNRRVQRLFDGILAARHVHVHRSSRVDEVGPGWLRAGGAVHEVDEILWTTDARAASWLRESGLSCDEGGFVRVSAALQSVSHPAVFAAGDVASMVGHSLQKSGVYAVRQGPPLAENLRRVLDGQPLRDYRPQRRFLSLISTGNRYAVASRGPLAFAAEWVWRWKDGIDRRFMRKYQELPRMSGLGTRGSGLDMAAGAAAEAGEAMRCGGCGAKVGADVLSRALARVRAASADAPITDLLIGLDAPDDAAVVDVPAGKAAVHTVDFFRAIVDDPYTFGRIAVSHALGDIYAMGAEPRTALAIVTIPYGDERDVEDTLTQLLAGATRTLRDAGAALVGGHTGEGAELALGFAMNGLVDRDRVLRKGGLRTADRLILTKPIGTGTLFAADMRQAARGRWILGAVESMTRLNRDAARLLLEYGASACTDVTGFGLLGHLVEMLDASGVDADLELSSIPLLDGAEEAAAAGLLSSLHPQNARVRSVLVAAPELSRSPRAALLFDPQTGGGLLAGVSAAAAEDCVRALRASGCAGASIIGTVVPRREVRACVRVR